MLICVVLCCRLKDLPLLLLRLEVLPHSRRGLTPAELQKALRQAKVGEYLELSFL
jgi:hypothetical protein